MNNYEIITLATHNYGTFNELINNPYKNIKVLGFGQKWTGFKMKYELMYNYIKNMNNDKIIIFLDGFDSEVNNNPNKAIQIFKSKNYKLLFSKLLSTNNNIEKFLLKKIYPYCIDNYTANSGMYMGYVKYLKIFFENILKNNCKDDQRITNLSCKNLNFITIDINYEIFENKYIKDKHIKSNAIFISYPGNSSFSRLSRGIFEYGQFFLKYLLIIYILLFLFLFYIKYYKILLVITILFILYLYNIDYSCV